ncbi:BatD family protein [Fibrobacter sp. UWB11]|uniref:BatD family protein n=1 Tax=Fibrobacter sp. UWB11 TaxID=1896202 RepID=UPI00092CAFE1|nr:BatD family protein [Fibrobacter sp. UWB11]SIO27557.1 Oxygen tolerance [Fibrobacter sp. UWB11]
MKRFFLLFFSLAAFVNAEPHSNIVNDVIQADETFIYELIVPHKDLPKNRSALRLETRNNFKLLKIDSTDELRPLDKNDAFTMFFGGSQAQRTRIYSFHIKAPEKTGKQVLGSLYWDADGKTTAIESNISVYVHRPYSKDAIDISLVPSKTTVYEGETFSITLKFHLYDHFHTPLQQPVIDTNSNFNITLIEKPKTDYKPVEDTNNELEASMLFAWLSPTKSGKLEISPIKVNYTQSTKDEVVKTKTLNTVSYEIKTDSISKVATATPQSITVIPLPADNKPVNFSGMVGEFRFDANFDRTHLKIGDALTLNINISGDDISGIIANPKLPDLIGFRWEIPEISTVKKNENSKTITSKNIKVILYPKEKKVFEIPAITYSWFNPSKKQYETASAGPWTIEVE